MLEKASWLDTESREAVLSKLDQMNVRLFGTDLVVNSDALDEFYENLRFDLNDSIHQMNTKIKLHISQHLLDMSINFNQEFYFAITQFFSDNNAFNVIDMNRLGK